MSCKPTYKGKRYNSIEELKSIFLNLGTKSKLNPRLFTDPAYAVQYLESRLLEYGYNANTGYLGITFDYLEANEQEHFLDFLKSYNIKVNRGANNKIGLRYNNKPFTAGNNPKTSWKDSIFDNPLPFAHIGAKPTLSENQASKLKTQLEDFMAANGIKVKSLDDVLNILKKQGRITGDIAGIGGIADAVNKVIGLAQGKVENNDAGVLAEEVGHIAIAMLGLDHRLVKPALDRVSSWEKYQEYYDEYFPVYKENLNMTNEQADRHTKIEILGKLLTEQIIKQSSPKINDRLKRNLDFIWNKILAFFGTSRAAGLSKNIEDTMGVLASKILNADTLETSSKNDPNSIFFNIEDPKLTRLTKDIKSDLASRVKALKNKSQSYKNPEIAYKEIAALKKRQEELETKLENEEITQGIWDHFKKLDSELQEMYEKVSDSNSAILRDSNRINDLLEFTEVNRHIVEKINDYLEDVLIETPETMPDDVAEKLESVIDNARKSIIGLRRVGQKFHLRSTDALMQELNPGEYKAGDLAKNYNKDLGILSWLQAFVGSLKNASNIALRTAFRLMTDIHNEVNNHTYNLKNDLMIGLREAEAAGLKTTDFMEKLNGMPTGRLLSRYNHAKIDKVYEGARDKLVKVFKKYDEKVETYDDVKEMYNTFTALDLDNQSVDQKKLIKEYRNTWSDTLDRIYERNLFDSISTDESSKVVLEQSFLGYRFKAPVKYVANSTRVSKLIEGQIVSLKDKEGAATRNFAKVTSIEGDVANLTIIDNTDIGIKKEFLTDETEYQRITKHPFYLQYLTALRKEKSKLPPQYRVGKHKWTFPGMTATKEELIKEGRFAALPNRWKHGYIHNLEDDMYGQSTSGPNGKIQKYLPVYFTNPVDPQIMSHDIVGSLVKFAAMSENFKQLSEKKGDLLLLQKHLAESHFDIKRKDSSSGKDTATYRMLTEFLDINLWGEQEEKLDIKVGDKTIAGDKILNTVYTWIESNNLAFAIPIAVSGALKGNIDQFIERVLGDVINFDSSVYATKQAALNMTGVLKDVGSRTKTNKTAALMEYTGLGFEGSNDQLNLTNKASRLIGTDIIYSPYVIADTDRKMRLLISIMDNLRTIDGITYTKEEYLATKSKEDRKAAEQTWKENRSNSLYNKASIEKGGITGLNKDELFRVKNHVADLGPRLEGRISTLERGAGFKNPWARFLFMHRSWLVSGVEHRFKSESTNVLTGVKQEGSYISTKRALVALAQNGFNFDQYKATWETLPDFQKRNVLRTGVDFAWMVGITLLTAAINAASDDGDDDDWILQYTAYQASRLLLEQQAFWNPTEIAALLKSPLAGVNQLEDLQALLGELIFKWDPIKSGPYKDQYPVQRFLWKRLWLKSLYELQHPRTKNQWLRSQVLKTGFNTAFYEPIEEALSDK